MTQEELKKQTEAILAAYDFTRQSMSPMNIDEQIVLYNHVINKVMQFINQHVAEVIGENEKFEEPEEDEVVSLNRAIDITEKKAINKEKAEQQKRADLTEK